MFIDKYQIGANCKKTVYAVCIDATKTGEARPREIARFNSLELAAIVMRYLRGDYLSEADAERAHDAIKEAAPTVESKGDHKAE